MSNQNGKVPTIGVFIPYLSNEWDNLLCKGIIEEAETQRVNVIVYPGRTPGWILNQDYQTNLIYGLVSPENIDALIIPSTMIGRHISREQLEQFYADYSAFPKVCIQLPVPVENSTNIRIDNQTALAEAINHLIKDHHRKRIAFIKGLANHPDAQERYAVYLEVLRINGWEVDPNLVCEGNFMEKTGAEAVATLVDQRKVNFDAIVAANDAMALAAIAALQSRGVRVPEDVSVIGFDNIDKCSISNPKLTTVGQPFYEIGKKALQLALDLACGGIPTEITIRTELVIRESCGCNYAMLPKTCNDKLSDRGLTDSFEASGRFIACERQRIDNKLNLSDEVVRFITKVFHTFKSAAALPETNDELFESFKSIFTLKQHDYHMLSYAKGLLARLIQEFIPGEENVKRVKSIDNFFFKAGLYLTEMYEVQTIRQGIHHDLYLRRLRGLLNVMRPNPEHIAESVACIENNLRSFGINRCCIYLYDREIYYASGDKWEFPEQVTSAIAFPKDEFKTVIENRDGIATREILNRKYLPAEQQCTMLVQPLFTFNIK